MVTIFFASSCTGATISIIRQYIEQQKTPDSKHKLLLVMISTLKDGFSRWSFLINETIKIRQAWEAESEYFSKASINANAGAALNVALWDCWAHTFEVPIWQLFGTNHTKIPVYGSGGWISYTEQELLDEVIDYKKRGFTAVKIKVESGSVENDLHRLKTCRDALGNSVKIMMDAN